MREVAVILLTVAGGLGTFLLGMKHLSEGLQALSGGGADAPLRTLALLDILNAFDRARSYYMNIAETLAGGKATSTTWSSTI